MAVIDDLEAWDDESIDDESLDIESFDDESFDDESELLGGLLGGPASVIGNALGGLFGSRGPSRPPLSRFTVGAPGAGVSTASLNTPAGNATLRLPEPVVSRREFEATIRQIQEGINRDTSRLNTIAKDVDGLTTRVAAAVTETKRDISKVRTAVTKSNQANQRRIARLRREQSSQQMMTMVMAMMTQQQLQESIQGHTHDPATGKVVDNDDSDNSMMMLPLMMMGQGGGSGNDAMMMPLMIMAMNPRK
ncbi:hypothetical protein [Pseudarthrobacter sp. YALA5]|uniref:hypothetical protein n=1 Tax=Pseudarthrobacter sp. DSP2-3-2b1 TaxID=2804661 RepID=UPI00103F18CC